MDDDFYDVGRLLLLAARDFSTQVCEELRGRDYPDLKAGHALVVSTLDIQGTRLSTLAERAELSKQAMGQLVKELEILGYLARQCDPRDARAVLIVPTKSGEKLLEDVGRLAKTITERHIAKIGREELSQLRQTLLKWLE